MDKKQLIYTCLSRTTKYEYIHLRNQKLNSKYKIRHQHKMDLVNSYFNTNFLEGKIYKVTFEYSDKLYFGSTCEILEDRLQKHIVDNKSAVYKYRHCNPKIELIVNAPSRVSKMWKTSI